MAEPPLSGPTRGDAKADVEITVCYFGTYRTNYSRNRIMVDGLRANGVTVIECHQPLWYSIDDRVDSISGGWKRARFWWRVAKTYAQLIAKFLKLRNTFDLLIVGYPGQFDIFVARLLAWWRGTPLVWDVFMSIYLIALERNLEEDNQRSVQFLRLIEKFGCRLPEQLILDTSSYAEWFEQTHHIDAKRFKLVPTGADNKAFLPQLSEPPSASFTVLYYGTYIPNHAVPVIIKACQLLRNHKGIRFVLVGDGPQKKEALRLSSTYQLTNIEYIDWVSQDELRSQIAQVHLCLGAFGETPQSLMTIQNKIYECLAMAKPVLSGDSPAIQQKFTHLEHLYLCPRNDPRAVADAIFVLATEPALCQRLAKQGHDRYLEEFTVERIGRTYRRHLLETLAKR